MINLNELTKELQVVLPCIGISMSTDGGDAYSVVTNDMRLDFSRFITPEEWQQALSIIGSHAPVWMDPRVQSIVADGKDIGIVLITGDANASVELDILTGDTPSQQLVSLDEQGRGELHISCTTPGTRILIATAGQSVVVQAV